MLVTIFSYGKRRTASIFLGSNLVPLLLTTWPKKVIFLQQNNIYSSLIQVHLPKVEKRSIHMLKMFLPIFIMHIEIINKYF